MPLSRRELLERCAALGLLSQAWPMLGCNPDDALGDDGFPLYTWDGEPGPATAFEHGVASADPLSDAALLWTRVSPGPGAGEVEVFVEVALSPDFTERVAVGTFTTGPDTDWTLTVDQTELQPATTYYFRFSALGRTSPIGRTRTLPAATLEHTRIAVCSCSNYGFGYFHAYRHLAARDDLDLVLHLGDYLYEHASNGFGFSYGVTRELDPTHELLTLSDYRRRYAHYRKDPDLQELHRQNPLLHTWDDHEFADNPRPGGSANHDDAEGSWDDRVAAALQACKEWLPHRMEGNVIYRAFALGDLATLLFTDRQRRHLWPEPDDAETYLGAAQTSWLLDEISAVSAPWLLLCSATTFTSRSPTGDLGSAFDGSPWDPTSRRAVLDAVADAGVENLVVLMGDIHRAEALDVAHDPTTFDPSTGAGSEGVELATGSITSIGFPSRAENGPHVWWTEHSQRTYLLLDLTRDRLHAEFWGFPDAAKTEPTLPNEALIKAFTCEAGSKHLVESTAATPTGPSRPLAP